MLIPNLRAFPLLILACTFCVGQSAVTPRFEVASVKPAAGTGFGRFSGGPGSSDPERITYERATLELLISNAYGLEANQVSGPSWLNTEWYTVTAKLPPGTTKSEFNQMLANLLVERFGLTFHRVMKDFPGYEISVAQGGPKLTPSNPNDNQPAVYRGSADANGVMSYIFTQTSMALLTNRLSLMMRRHTPGHMELIPVVDRTGISGKFDFHLDVVTPPSELSGSDFDDNSANISDALKSQVGLQLKHTKITLEVLVVDHAERVPTAN
jgi:uncharacterized protein (TIGR03435 family)